MDARSTRAIAALRTLAGIVGLCTLIVCAESLSAAGVRTQNFIVTARQADFARRVAEAAERYRAELAVEWLGEELPPWPQPCPIEVKDAPGLGAGGATSFMFDRGRPFGWTMSIQGSRERILDSVLPHEVTHTIFATHFGQPVPRWADEGACTTVEHSSERAKQQQFLIEFLMTGRGIPFNSMFRMTEYPHDIMPLYSQGHSVAQFLIGQGGKRRFVDFVGYGMASHNWDKTIKKFYGFDDLSNLQLTWVDWVKQGSPAMPNREQAIAGASPSVPPREAVLVAAADRGPARNASRGVAASFASTSTQVAARSSGTSWYAKQRDRAHQQGQRGLGPASVRGLATTRQATRAQPAQQTQEHVLEWNDASPPGSSNAKTAAPTVPPGYDPRALPVPPDARNRSPIQYSQLPRVPDAQGGNVWR